MTKEIRRRLLDKTIQFNMFTMMCLLKGLFYACQQKTTQFTAYLLLAKFEIPFKHINASQMESKR